VHQVLQEGGRYLPPADFQSILSDKDGKPNLGRLLLDFSDQAEDFSNVFNVSGSPLRGHNQTLGAATL
jgi:hypothetical protein